MKNQPEYHLQKQVCQWLDLQHSELLYMTDTVAAVRLTFAQGNRNKAVQKKDFKCPDLLIFEPNSTYHGLFIELKVETPFKKNGDLKKNDHLEGQAKTIKDLRAKGYYACFAWSFEMVQEIVNNYLKG